MSAVRATVRLVGMGICLVPLYPCLLGTRLLERFAPVPAVALRCLLTRTWARTTLFVMGIRVVQEGTPPRPPFLAVGNHLSWLDILVLLSRLEARFVSKAEVAGWPLAGHLATIAGTVYLDRGRKRDLKRTGSALESALSRGEGAVVFPEGTSTRGAEVLPFRASLFQVAVDAEVPVAPFSLQYRTPEDQPPAHLVLCWWGDMDFAPHFWGALKLRSAVATLRFPAARPVGEDRKELALEAHRTVSSAFVPSLAP